MVYILELKTTQAAAIKIVIDAVNSLLTDANFNFYPYYIEETDNSTTSNDKSSNDESSDNNSPESDKMEVTETIEKKKTIMATSSWKSLGLNWTSSGTI